MSASMTKLVGLTAPIQVNVLACQNFKTFSNIKNIDNYLFTLMAVRWKEGHPTAHPRRKEVYSIAYPSS